MYHVAVISGIIKLQRLLGWEFIGWAIAIMVPLGVGMVAKKNEATIAKFCFLLTALLLGAKTFMWGISTERPFEWRGLILVGCFSAIGLFAVESVRWVNTSKIALISPVPPSVPTLSLEPRNPIAPKNPAAHTHQPQKSVEQKSYGANSPNIAAGDNAKVDIQ